jgi:hypothetical protein
MDQNPLRNQNSRVESTQRLEPQKALIVYMANHKADFIHMGGQHDPQVSGAFLNSGDIAQRIDMQVVHQGP